MFEYIYINSERLMNVLVSLQNSVRSILNYSRHLQLCSTTPGRNYISCSYSLYMYSYFLDAVTENDFSDNFRRHPALYFNISNNHNNASLSVAQNKLSCTHSSSNRYVFGIPTSLQSEC